MTNEPTLDGELLVEPAARALAADDFGHAIRRTPRAVLRPGSVEDIAAMVRWAAANGTGIAARGMGHSVFGRSQVDGGVVIDMTTLDAIHHIGDDRIVVDAGTTWRAILARTLPSRRTPPVLTNYLDLTVGGTLSIGGVGGTSHRYGLQSDNVLELEVVTGEGKVVTCSPSENIELYEGVRAGLGQFGIITRATLALVPAPDRVRRYALAYADLESLAADERLVLRERRADHLQGTIAAGNYQLEMVVFQPVPDDQVLAGLSDDRSRAQLEDLSYREYTELFDRYTTLLRSTGEWTYAHPWLLTFLPGSSAEKVASDIVRDLVPADLGEHGLITFYPLATSRIATPFARIPDEPVVFTFNLIRFAPDDAALEHMLAQNRELYRRVRASGAMLYPVSALSFSGAEWEEHYGPVWPKLRELKQRFDPANSLTPGYPLFG